jgi:hypothetical protein
LSGRANGTAKTGDGPVEMLRMFRLARASAVKSRSQAINQLKAIIVGAEAALRESMSGLTGAALIRHCANLPEAGCDRCDGYEVTIPPPSLSPGSLAFIQNLHRGHYELAAETPRQLASNRSVHRARPRDLTAAKQRRQSAPPIRQRNGAATAHTLNPAAVAMRLTRGPMHVPAELRPYNGTGHHRAYGIMGGYAGSSWRCSLR